ncbi:MAG: dethiobiotin synthase [Hyphomonadaceae bacterium]
MSALFVAGAGTDIGKTEIACGLIRALRARGVGVDAFKPLLSGFDPAAPAGSDAARLLDALGRAVTPEEIAAMSPWRFRAPLAPNMAARAEGAVVRFEAVQTACVARVEAAAPGLLLVEGAGGLMSPLSDETTFLDLTGALHAPSLLVAGSYLGAISHALTALEALRARALSVRALIVSESAQSGVTLAETVQALARLAGPVPVLAAPRYDRAGFDAAMQDVASRVLA